MKKKVKVKVSLKKKAVKVMENLKKKNVYFKLVNRRVGVMTMDLFGQAKTLMVMVI